MVLFNQEELARLLVSDTVPSCLLGADLLAKVHASISYQEDGAVKLTGTLNDQELCLLAVSHKTPWFMFASVLPEDEKEALLAGPTVVNKLPVPPVEVEINPSPPLPWKMQYLLCMAQMPYLKQYETFLKNQLSRRLYPLLTLFCTL